MHTNSTLENTHQMHEKSSPVIFDVVGGAVKIGVVEGREVWGSTFALFHCADVALGYCFMLRCSSTFFFSPPSPPVFQHISPSFSLYFHLSAIIFASIISPRLLLQCYLPLSFI